MYYAIIGDMINSKKLSHRAEVQKSLKDALDRINEEFNDYIASKFIITLGDEFQGLLYISDKIFDIIERIKMELYPVKIRFGIGYGELYTEINKELSIGADGPAFYYARDMINEIKKNEKSKMGKNIEILFCSKSDFDGLINSNLALCSFIEKKWTKRQREIVADYLKNGGNQKKAAERLGITQSNIQRGLKNSGFYNYLYAKETIKEVLKTGDNNYDL